MNSCLYLSRLEHIRRQPRENAFAYSIYSFYLDLDELDDLHRDLPLFSYNSRNVFAFYDDDHFKFLRPADSTADLIAKEKVSYRAENYAGQNTKERIRTLIGELGLGFELGKVFVFTNLRVFGYVFNPVSFYYCFDTAGVFRALFSEVNNTFGDQKMYLIPIDDPSQAVFRSTQKKNYYISPFISHRNDLAWEFTRPGETFRMAIDSRKRDEVELHTVLTGRRRELSNRTLFFLNLRYPAMTALVIFWIHYQALRLFFKKVPFFRKAETDKLIADDIGAGKRQQP